MRCRFCSKRKAHDASFCPAKPSRPKDISRRCQWADKLIAAERVRVEDYDALSLDEAVQLLLERGEHYNTGNPAAVVETRGQPRSLKSQIGFWKALGADRVVLSWLWYGVPQRFKSKPPRRTWPNSESAFKHAEFVKQAIADQVAVGKFVVVDPSFAEVVHPLQVEDNGKKLRLVMNMIPTNAWLGEAPFRNETLGRVAVDTFMPGDHLLTADLQKAYYSVMNSEEALPYNCFEWEGTVYASRCLLFGNSLGPFFFTKLGRPIVAFFRTLRVRCSIFLDDIISSVPPKDSENVGGHIEALLLTLGWRVSPKSELTGATRKVFTGFEIDTEAMTFTIPDKKVANFLAVLAEVHALGPESCPVPCKLLQKLEGHLSSMHLAVRPAMLYVRTIARARARGSEDGGVMLTDDELADLAALPALVAKFNGSPIRPSLAEVFAHLDAGQVGLGARTFADRFSAWQPPATMATTLTPEDMKESSTLRELLTAMWLLDERGEEWQDPATLRTLSGTWLRAVP
jgi:hypothetical protein